MSSFFAKLLRLSLFAPAIALAACMGNKQQAALPPAKVPPPEEKWTEQPIAVPAQEARPVKEGPAPLIYLVETDTMIRVADLTAHVDLLTMPVMARQIVHVDPDAGVQISGATMRMGALPTDHRYGIFLQSTTENVTRTGSIQPGQSPNTMMPSRSQP